MRAASLREARRHVASPAEAEDVAQEALALAWRWRDACRAPDDPLPWLRAIVRREAYRHLSRWQEIAVADPVWPDSPTDTHLEAHPERLDVRAALRGLSAWDRAAIGLRYAGDMTQPAIAAALGAPEGTVKVRLHRARNELRRAMTT
jgi:RNA polymerase sigma-70 factor, ECF subfamily